MSGVRGERHKAQGTGHKAKTIKENLCTPYALRLTPYALCPSLLWTRTAIQVKLPVGGTPKKTRSLLNQLLALSPDCSALFPAHTCPDPESLRAQGILHFYSVATVQEVFLGAPA